MAAVVREGRWRVGRLALNFSTGQGRRRRRGQCHWRSCSPPAWRVRATGVSAAADPHKDAVQSGIALVMRGLLQTMYAYCEGPPSTPQVDAELAKQRIEAGRVLRRYGRHVASGAVGNVGSQGWATHRVRTN